MIKKTTTEKKPAAKTIMADKPAAAPKKAAPKKTEEIKTVEKKTVEVTAKPAAKVASASDKLVATPRKKGASAIIIGAVGRRKAAVARVWVRRGKGTIAVNKQPCAEYFNTDETRTTAVRGLVSCDLLSKYDVIANVKGGGKVAQADAVNLGISRALVKDSETHRVILRANGSLTVDSRNKERKKPGQKGARAKFQFVKR